MKLVQSAMPGVIQGHKVRTTSCLLEQQKLVLVPASSTVESVRIHIVVPNQERADILFRVDTKDLLPSWSRCCILAHRNLALSDDRERAETQKGCFWNSLDFFTELCAICRNHIHIRN
jgi:hypothetical protein